MACQRAVHGEQQELAEADLQRQHAEAVEKLTTEVDRLSIDNRAPPPPKAPTD